MQKGYWDYLIKISGTRVWFQETYLLDSGTDSLIQNMF